MSVSHRIVYSFTAKLHLPHNLSSSSSSFFPSRIFFRFQSRSLTYSTSLLFSSLMPNNQRRGGYKEKKWQVRPSSNRVPGSSSNVEPVSAATTEAITDRLSSLDITESGAQSSVPVASLQFGSVGLAPQSPVQHQKVIWKPKSYGTVSGAPKIEAEKTPNEPKSALLSKLFKGSLLENFTVDNSTFSRAQIRATFYPKFENEKSDQEIRTRMIEMVSKGLATVEVSLKHSGSLFMYAGHEGGAYAKNSFGNMYVLLRIMAYFFGLNIFYFFETENDVGLQAMSLGLFKMLPWVHIGSSKSSAFLEDRHGYTAVGVFVLGRMFRETWGTQASKKQAEFNEFLERNRMCISMELVTAVLGDHGQRPQDDYGKVSEAA
ncbi:hypothetical protein MTR67_049710 [Solanum verrucosum]|uniref:Uncharacterized protein n=1 Tax=Solanum verrucosum TaxID=315347 RepID=A0AAF0V1X2_SOLVR|nr:hypothetical protein MTR67_049710 [Solanum verrucosum]